MTLYERELMDKPSYRSESCPVCGRPATNQHHVVYRSHGGGNGPTISLCGFGNASGCHGLAHRHMLHFRYHGGWQFRFTDEPVGEMTALELPGWRYLPGEGS